MTACGFLSHIYDSPHRGLQRRYSCPLCSTTPTASGPSFLLPSQALKSLSSGKRSANLLQGWQEQPQICFQKMMRHRHLLGEKGLYSNLFQKAEEQEQGGHRGTKDRATAQPNSNFSTGDASKRAPKSY